MLAYVLVVVVILAISYTRYEISHSYFGIRVSEK